MQRAIRIGSLFLIFLIALILQSTLLPALAIGGISPNLLLILVVAVGIHMGDVPGMVCGFFVGFACDVLFGELLGFYALIYLVLGYLSGKAGNFLFVEDIKFPLIAVGVMDGLYGLYCYIFQFLFANRIYGFYFFRHFVMPEMLYTVLFAVLIYPAFHYFFERVLREKSQSERRAAEESHV